MIEPNLLRNKLNFVSEKLARKKFKIDLEKFNQQENSRKKLQTKTENLQAERNIYSKKIGIAKYRKENIDELIKKVNEINKLLNITKKELNSIKKEIKEHSLLLPNIPADEVPNGSSTLDNKEILRWGKPRKYNFRIRDHIELGKIEKEIDFSLGTKLTGTRFTVMRGNIAYLHRILIQFMLDLHIKKHGYLEYYLPYMVNNTSLYCTGQLPKFHKDLFHIQPLEKDKDNYYLIPTAEVPLINLIRNEIIEEDTLPLKMISHTPCFRSEAGTYGRNSYGLIRMHQFEKVEIVQIVKPIHSMQVLEEMTNHAEKVLQLLKLPYRKVLLCTGSMSFTSCKTYDLEVWLPSKNNYCEISSCSNIGDFQSRRLNTRYRSKKQKKLQLVHTLNGSGLAVSRTLAAILENYQLSNGCIIIPEVLQPYMKGMTYIGKINK